MIIRGVAVSGRACVACELAHLCEFGENYFGGGADIQRGKTHSGQPAKFFPELTKVSLLNCGEKTRLQSMYLMYHI